MARRNFRLPVLGALVVGFYLVAESSPAAPFSDLIVFGDSLSDVGNVAQASFDIYPGEYYFNDRFSNGPVWVESLATQLGLGSIERSTAGGDNFAYGGAQTTGTSGLEGLVIRDVDEQVTQFLGSRTADSAALYVVLAGSNDLIGATIDAATRAASLATDIGRLVAAGARELLIPNLPPLGLTPRFNASPSQAIEYNQRAAQFNAALNDALADLLLPLPTANVYRLDIESLFHDAVLHPDWYGLQDVATPAAPGLQPGDGSYDANQIAANPDEYLFWDDLHPTAAVHQLLADRAIALLDPLPGDLDFNGAVDQRDLSAWHLNFGTTGVLTQIGDSNRDRDVDGYDLLAWQHELGGRRSLLAVPEPTTWRLLVLCALAASLLALRRRPF